MSLTIHTIYGVGIGSTLLGGITQQGSEIGSEIDNEVSSGAVYPRGPQAVTAQKPMITFGTRAIAPALQAVGLTGQSISALAGHKLAIYAQAAEHGGTRQTGSNHRRIIANHGLIVPKTLTCDHQGNAVLTYEATITYDGSNDPFVIADSQALPAGLTDAERFTLGTAQTLQSLSIGQVTNLNLDFGIEVASEGADSDVWDEFAYIVSIKPVLTLRGTQLNWFGSSKIPLTGKAVTHSNTSLYLRKREHGGTYVADGTAEHIKISVDGMATIDTPWDGSGDGPNECLLRVDCRYDGSNAPVVFDTTSAIT